MGRHAEIFGRAKPRSMTTLPTLNETVSKRSETNQRLSYVIPRDALHSADHAVVRCLSVCLSVTRRYCVETAKHSLKLFHHLAAPLF